MFFYRFQGGASGLVEAITKFSSWFAAVDISEDKKISRSELYDHLVGEILKNIGTRFYNKKYLRNFSNDLIKIIDF